MTPDQFNTLPTPRTASEMKIVHNSGLVMASFAAKLEREVALLEQAMQRIATPSLGGYSMESIEADQILRTLAEVRNTK